MGKKKGKAVCAICFWFVTDPKDGSSWCEHYKNQKEIKPVDGVETIELMREPWEINKNQRCKWFQKEPRHVTKRRYRIILSYYKGLNDHA